ncbi:MAG: hypothetical protein PHP03_03595 [Candidatus Pacebacteria bacterium]|nr:hypothetical protein [Candidatus Paceibacterota bacterium]
MKACLFLQRKFAPIGNKIAGYLKQYGINEFCAVTTPRTAYNFLVSQKEVPYSKIILDEDIHKKYKDEKLDWDYLNQLEKEYGLPNLWPYLYIDRVLMNGQLIREYPHNNPLLSGEDLLKTLQITSKEIIKFLKEEKPDFLFISVIGSLTSLLLYSICQKMGIKTLNLDYTRMGNGIVLSDDYKTFSGAYKIFEDIQSGKIANPKEKQAKKFLEEFQAKPTAYVTESGAFAPRPTARLKQLKFLLPKQLIKNLRWFLKWCWQSAFKKDFDYTDERPLWSLIDKIKRKFREMRGFSDLYEKPDFSENFAFFPLHLEPEIATMLYAPFFTDQISLIRQIARSLPIGLKLYVKEHPSMLGYRTRNYYKEIIKIPNVKLIDPSYSSFDLISKAKITFAISGTAGWETALLKKPVITFGDVFYNKLSAVKKSDSPEKLPFLVKEQLEKFHYNDKEVINFISAIMADSIDADLVLMWESEDQKENIEKNQGLKDLAGLIAKKLNLANGTEK